MFCLHHPKTTRLRAGDVEQVEVGRACTSRVTISIEGDNRGDATSMLEHVAHEAGWRGGRCPEHVEPEQLDGNVRLG